MKKLIITILTITNLLAVTYKYDALNRLKVATYDNGVVYKYSYDDGGNLLSVKTEGITPSKDTDGDGITDEKEKELGLNPNSKDSDGDGYLDNEEIGDINHPTDTDGDGVIDALDTDSDNDGITDEDEKKYGFNPKDASDANEDADGDGVSNIDEINNYHTNPNNKDSDGDGVDDNDEIEAGYDPNDENSKPTPEVTIKTYDRTSFYVSYDPSELANYVLVMPKVDKIYIHKTGDISNLQRIDGMFESLPVYDNGELCFGMLKDIDTLDDSYKELDTKLKQEDYHINVMSDNCYDVKLFYIQKAEETNDDVYFMLYDKSQYKLYEGIAGDNKSFKIVKDKAKTFNQNSISKEDYTFIRFDEEKALIEILNHCDNQNPTNGQCEDE